MTEKNQKMRLSDIPNYEKLKKYDLLFLCKFGSHLYGTDTPESDIDLKGVYVPSLKNILLNKTERSINLSIKNSDGIKNSKDDVDIELISLHYFIELALKGETMALDMLHANEDAIIVSSVTWEDIRRNRSRFYTKNLNSYCGYARNQAAKYGCKGSRLADMKNVLDFVNLYVGQKDAIRLNVVWDSLPQGEHIHKLDPQIDDKNQYRMYQVAGQCFQETVSLQYMYDAVQKRYSEYGERARKAEANEGVDWKAISHAIRAVYQIIEILDTGDLKYPLKEAEYLKLVKQGKVKYSEVSEKLELLLSEAEKKSNESHYPEKPDVDLWMRAVVTYTWLSVIEKNSLNLADD